MLSQVSTERVKLPYSLEVLQQEVSDSRSTGVSEEALNISDYESELISIGGDCESTYEAMAETLRGGLSLACSGFSFWSHDIGGFEVSIGRLKDSLSMS
jgi:hypothetical protein